MVAHILHFLKQHDVKEERILMNFLSKRFDENYKHTAIAQFCSKTVL